MGEITIDCQSSDLAKAAEFWEQLLGLKAAAFEDHYRFEVSGDDLRINLQSVMHEPRVHIDIETDDIEAEVLRIEALGGVRIRTERRWVVMQTPTGHGICICEPARRDFEIRSTTWR